MTNHDKLNSLKKLASMPEPSEQCKKSTLARSVFLLPALLTLSSMFAGFYAIIAVMQGHFIDASIAIFVAMVFDGLDGRLARITNTATPFGAQLDSIADMVSFGLAPAVMLYVFALYSWGQVGWLVAFLYAACTGLRLAKFNIAPSDKMYFYGLSTPSAAAVVVSFVWVVTQFQLHGLWIHYVMLGGAVVLALLKVSSIPYRSFKDIDLTAKVSILMIIILILIFMLIWAAPARVLLCFSVLYAISGPVLWVVSQIFKDKKKT